MLMKPGANRVGRTSSSLLSSAGFLADEEPLEQKSGLGSSRWSWRSAAPAFSRDANPGRKHVR